MSLMEPSRRASEHATDLAASEPAKIGERVDPLDLELADRPLPHTTVRTIRVRLDLALELTFPASDPVALSSWEGETAPDELDVP